MRKKLQDLTNKETFTLKRDFNMTKFLLKAKPDEAFKITKESDGLYTRTNTSSNIKLKNNVHLNEADVVRLIEAKRTVVIFYEIEKRLDAYNFSNSMDLLNWVIAS
ncbi:hypothetical protein [Limosilactobacillus reuteri]|uniref:hypothetical protein n=1 Tax=Limosilactobacillus reuteri TaxID=1598 RepID=UPI001CDBD9FC|nr:hypothetical protein [Limosilactobacillus reuteri]